jgi:ATP-dependent HslUV protease ATP-binding subunit HslU
MVRDLVDSAIDMVRNEREAEVEDLAHERVEERLLDLLLPPPEAPKAGTPPQSGAENEPAARSAAADNEVFLVGAKGPAEKTSPDQERYKRTRDKLRQLLKDGQLEGREVEVEVTPPGPSIDVFQTQGAPEGMGGMGNIGEMLQNMLPQRKKKRTVKVSEARRILADQEFDKLIDMEDVTGDALERVEQLGIVFLDEIDKIAGERSQMGGPDVSREGVQRDLLPIVEGSNVQTKHGMVKTDHVLFIAAGAFHVSKPSDLIPELQGRFPIRVELKPLTEADLVRIMTEPENALTKQYTALVDADGAKLSFSDDGVKEIARIAALMNERMENIGARRLHTVMTTLLEDVLFELPDGASRTIIMDGKAVSDRLKAIVEDEDLRRYIL